MRACNADLGHPCDANDGEPCDRCSAHLAEDHAFYGAMWRAATLLERDPNAYREQMRDAGRAHLLTPEDT